MEWDGESGAIRYYDKQDKKNVPVGNKFTFILLDQLSCIKGWHDASGSGIFSNEVKDTRRDPFIVKAFKGGNAPLAQGVYASIRDRVASVGGKFHANLYVAFRNGNDQMSIGSIMLKGAALREWMEFTKANRSDLYKKAVVINGSKEGKKGKIVFHTPIFTLKDITAETDEQATEMDRQLQSYLKAYLSKPTAEHVADRQEQDSGPEPEPEHAGTTSDNTPDPDDIPW